MRADPCPFFWSYTPPAYDDDGRAVGEVTVVVRLRYDLNQNLPIVSLTLFKPTHAEICQAGADLHTLVCIQKGVET